MTERVLILGASSAIAAEVARIYAARGARLHLVARNADKLTRVVSGLPSTDVSAAVADFGECAHNAQVVREAFERLGGVDVVLIAHGDLGDQLQSENEFERAASILTVNFVSVVSLLIPIASAMSAQRSGTIGVITSVAGDRGRPRNYTYGAAKGGLGIYLQGLRSRLLRARVRVVTLKLGPVDTPMTRDHRKNVLFAQPAGVAAAIVSALSRGSAEVYVPWYWGAIMPLVKHAPERIFQLLPFLSGR